MEEQKHPGGRPLKFQSVEELETAINLYFDDCDKEEDTRVWSHDEIVEDAGKKVCSNCWKGDRTRGCLLVSGKLKLPRPYTVTGLALWLDTTRQTLLEYQGEVEGRERDPKFADAIVRAKARIENYASERLFDPDAPMRGIIFSLSNNAKDWAEKKDNTVRFPSDGAKELAKALMSGDTPIADDDSNADDGAKEGDA